METQQSLNHEGHQGNEVFQRKTFVFFASFVVKGSFYRVLTASSTCLASVP